MDPIAALNVNWSPIGGGTAGQILNVLAKRTAITNTVGTEGTNKFDSLQVRAVRQFAHGFQFAANYTFAKAEAYSTQVAIPYDFRTGRTMPTRPTASAAARSCRHWELLTPAARASTSALSG